MASRLCKLLAAADRNCTSVTWECSSKHTAAIRLFNQQQSAWDDVQLQHAVNTSDSPGILRFNICCTWVRNWAHYDNHFFNETTCIHSPIPAHTGRCQQVRWQTTINNWQQLTAAEIDWWLQQWLHSDAGFRWGSQNDWTLTQRYLTYLPCTRFELYPSGPAIPNTDLAISILEEVLTI